jgi:hypothetical protein
VWNLSNSFASKTKFNFTEVFFRTSALFRKEQLFLLVTLKAKRKPIGIRKEIMLLTLSEKQRLKQNTQQKPEPIFIFIS